ncbi:hypothetical protein PAPYR_12670 [Paratrimastix pyriformis]|uniref:Uncharacterized protein n=1 Tax=Paratrimastix pyriformis TaxID=342808 RepID=A0ABQ8U592_9EUKA|nr:hypothetical protein PAPYR_12670 [Paratrimastix pyriformis]
MLMARVDKLSQSVLMRRNSDSHMEHLSRAADEEAPSSGPRIATDPPLALRGLVEATMAGAAPSTPPPPPPPPSLPTTATAQEAHPRSSASLIAALPADRPPLRLRGR